MTSSNLPDAADRRAADRFLNRILGTISLVLVAWMAAGLFREPPSSWTERCLVTFFAFAFAVPPTITLLLSKTLPALDRTPRLATVTGRENSHTDPDPDSLIPPYELITVTLDIDGSSVESLIADIIAPESIDRFVIGSAWQVYAFADGPLALKDDPTDTRVILTEAHDDVIRDGYDLIKNSLTGSHGPGSDLLLRRFASDRSA